MNRERLAALDRAITFKPQPGPQLDAFLSRADQLLYGGAAGGGKTALAIGLALTQHKSTLFIRREATQLVAVQDEIAHFVGSRDGLNASLGIWRLPGRLIRLGGVPNAGDELKYQGAARDLLVVDEAANVLESQARFLLGWLRSTDPKQRCRALFCSNPPTSAEGEWLVRWWAPWLDPSFPSPAQPTELRHVAMIDGTETWVDGAESIMHRGERITPISRTFVPSKITDNVYLRTSGYLAQLQALPEPLRSQMLHGSFTAGRADDAYQVIPSAWVKAAMARWLPTPTPSEISSLGVDPSRGGDETVISVRRGWRFDPLVLVPASAAIHGGNVAKCILDVAGEIAPVHVDCIGIGASVVDHLEAYIGRRCVPVNFATPSAETDFSGNLRFANKRAEAYWRFRELLDPSRGLRVTLPRDQRLLADLCAPRYSLTARGILVEAKEDIRRRLGRSPDRGDAAVLAAMRTPIIIDHNSSHRFAVRRSIRGYSEEA